MKVVAASKVMPSVVRKVLISPELESTKSNSTLIKIRIDYQYLMNKIPELSIL